MHSHVLLYGRSSFNSPSRFIKEISDDIIEVLSEEPKSTVSSKSYHLGNAIPQAHIKRIVTSPAYKESGGDKMDWQVGDKAIHKKWGKVRLLVSEAKVKILSLDIAFPSPTGIKRLLAKFAPIEKA